MKLRLISLAMLAVLAFSSCRDQLNGPPSNTPPSSDTVAYWTFDGNGNDVSGNRRNATLSGTFNYIPDRFGNAGKAIEFVGYGQMNVLNMPNFTDNDSYTVSFWVNFSAGGSLLSQGYGFGADTGVFSAVLGGCGQITSSQSLGADKWRLMTVAVSAHNSATLYIDTMQVAESAYGDYTGSNDSMPLQIAFNQLSSGTDTTLLDNALFLHYCLSKSQVMNRFHEGGWTGQTGTLSDTSVQFVKGSVIPVPVVYALCFPEPKDGYACGIYGSMAASHDSGVTWTKLNTGEIYDDLFGISFGNAGTGVAVGGASGGVIIRTTNSGQNWSAEYHPPQTQGLRDVKFMSDGIHAICVGYDSSNSGNIFTSADAGVTWTLVKTTSHALNSIGISNSTGQGGYAVVVGDSGEDLTTNDMGATWNDNSSGTASMTKVSLDPSTGVANNAVAISGGTSTFWSTDMGQTWIEHPTDGSTFTAVYEAGGGEAWAQHETGNVLQTLNRGVTWTADAQALSVTNGPWWNCIGARDVHHIAFVAQDGDIYWLIR